jgi:DNA-directed RNA polymerase specialized sigma24 family protein
MSARPSCSCPLCELEHALLGELKREHAESRYRTFVLQSPILSAFPSYNDLLLRLRDSQLTENRPSRADEIIGELLRISRTPCGEVGHQILLLILMPAIHRTTTQIATGFPSLTRDDIAQHLITSVWEILHSETLETLTSHYAFTIIRGMRRSGFRWAMHEADFTSAARIHATALNELPATTGHDFEVRIALSEFLTRCLSCGVLSASEYELLVLIKLQGVSSETLAARQSLSDVALRHRVQRVVEKLRRAARGPMASEPLDDPSRGRRHPPKKMPSPAVYFLAS